jgi:hypothetical protein
MSEEEYIAGPSATTSSTPRRADTTIKHRDPSIVEQPADSPQKQATFAFDTKLRKWVKWFGVCGTSGHAAYFFAFMISQTI